MIALVLLKFDSVAEAEAFIDDLDDDQPAALVAMEDLSAAVVLQ